MKTKEIPDQYLNKKEVSYVCTKCKLFRLDMRDPGCAGAYDLSICLFPQDKKQALKAVHQ